MRLKMAIMRLKMAIMRLKMAIMRLKTNIRMNSMIMRIAIMRGGTLRIEPLSSKMLTFGTGAETKKCAKVARRKQ